LRAGSSRGTVITTNKVNIGTAKTEEEKKKTGVHPSTVRPQNIALFLAHSRHLLSDDGICE
jgi:hypothetical protein